MNELSLLPPIIQKCDQGGERCKVFTHANQLSVGREEAAVLAAAEWQDGSGAETGRSPQLWEVLEIQQTQDTAGTAATMHFFASKAYNQRPAVLPVDCTNCTISAVFTYTVFSKFFFMFFYIAFLLFIVCFDWC